MASVYSLASTPGGGVPKITTFLTSGTFTADPLAKYTVVEMVGGGGAGGAPTNGTSGSIGTGAGGNSGAYVKVQLTPTEIGVSQLVTIGAGGIGTNNSVGSSGGSSIFGGFITANGGAGGGNALANNNTNGFLQYPLQSARATFAINTGIDLGSSYGDLGERHPVSYSTLFVMILSNSGANSMWGSGAIGSYSNATLATNLASNGVVATGFGAGGSSAYITGIGGTVAGGNGTAGKIIITEYF